MVNKTYLKSVIREQSVVFEMNANQLVSIVNFNVAFVNSSNECMLGLNGPM